MRQTGECFSGMCGIAGVFHYASCENADERVVRRMSDALAHRGPDGEGVYCDGPIGLGHRRLAIVDVSPAGAQPMTNSDRSCWISYNGELYNHIAYRRRLESKGYTFRGRSDTETLLYLMESEGPSALEGIAGIFAFAYWDGRRRELTLARDPLGVKQLYYHDDGRRIVFASEIKALLTCRDVPREADPEAVNEYLHFHTPLFERTFFRGIRQLRAGEYLQVTRYGNRIRRYWEIKEIGGDEPGTSVEELRHVLGGVVREQLMSDVPLGSFFSGGIDSSAVAAYASQTGGRPRCFGVHFSGQGVPDERPYQESAARALRLDLELITADGSTFPQDLFRLMYHQDQPVIGPAMFPMYYVSRLAAGKVKVCLGGQGADEIFGGYARYALVKPAAVVQSWFSGREGTRAEASAHSASVGGNLGRQLVDMRNLYRLWQTCRNLHDWEERYFSSFAKVPAGAWRDIVVAPELFDRGICRQIFHETVQRSPAADPAGKVMHWDVQTYLTGLFQQDDRMSMAVGLESRVPLADPRIVQLGFRIPFQQKFCGGATKWILRQAVSDVLPEMVLNRRKVGFDTPVERWIRTSHRGFVRDILLSTRSRQRGFFDPDRVDALLRSPRAPFWIDMIWKMLSIETWARIFLDTPQAEESRLPDQVYCYRAAKDPRALPDSHEGPQLKLQHVVREVHEMGLRNAASRALWEVKTRAGLAELGTAIQSTRALERGVPAGAPRAVSPLFADPDEVAAAISPLLQPPMTARLIGLAAGSAQGRILSFGRWVADYGNPIDWHRNPHNGRRWASDRHWSRSLAGQGRAGDVKLIWEVGRFPHAYLMARAGAFHPEGAEAWKDALTAQVADFLGCNPRPYGVHWNSSQEIAIRLLAWLFAANTFSRLPGGATELREMFDFHLPGAARHIADHIAFARDSVYNNHLISEALGLYLAGTLLSGDEAGYWQTLGREILTEEAGSQFYPDGAYIQQSHNYHRLALQLYLAAIAVARMGGEAPAESWLKALERSLDFLYAHQNTDGRLPNYGANDGALPAVLTSCDFSDFRPVLQAASIACRGERVYDPGPWDEEAAWFFGPAALRAPLRPPARTSVAFRHTGYHVLRGRDAGTYATLRCGTILDRFSQIDMLHCDVWWRGHNVLCDPGSYLYNGPEAWHRHFNGTSSHNTVTIDGCDQMLHFRKFKNLYWTKAKLTRFSDDDDRVLCEGEHYGYLRHSIDCVHRRCVLFSKNDDLWIVTDTITGAGKHRVRLHWLGGDFPFTPHETLGQLTLHTPAGPFSVTVLDESGRRLCSSVVAGSNDLPRGWMSRYYGERVAAPSLSADLSVALPFTAVTVLCGGARPEIETAGESWRVRTRDRELSFVLRGGSLEVEAPAMVETCAS
jgi:asparagine synthase (glutamine-hydrolysing)